MQTEERLRTYFIFFPSNKVNILILILIMIMCKQNWYIFQNLSFKKHNCFICEFVIIKFLISKVLNYFIKFIKSKLLGNRKKS